MSRTQEQGISYFPLDVGFLEDTKLKVLKAKYGSDGVMIFIYIMCRIYREGYYTRADEDFYYIVSMDLNMSIDKVEQVMTFLLGRSMLDEQLFKSDAILTSAGIQERWQKAIAVRASKTPIEVVGKYWRLSAEKTRPFIKVTFQEISENSSEKKDVSSEKKDDNSKKYSQSKVKESKGKYIPPSARDTREEESSLSENEDDDKTINVGLRDFLKKHKNIVVDNCSNSNLSMMDYDLLDFRFSESEYLSENIHDLSWVAKNYHRIIAGEYKTKPTQGTARRTKQNEGGISAQIDRLLKKFAEEDKLNGIDET